jgi:hypothetical protein
MERVLVFGDRKWTDGDRIFERLNQIQSESGIECFIDSGGSDGAVALGRKVAENLGLQILKLPKRIQDMHGPDKNEEMLRFGKPTLVLVFHDNLGMSKRTRNMVVLAEKAGIRVEQFQHISEG